MIKKLESKFIGTGEVAGLEFIQVERTDKYAIYQVNSYTSFHYEVFEIKTTPICIDFEKRIYSETDFKEVYPKSKDFGITAFTCHSFEDAKNKAKQRFNHKQKPN